jgi:hypothetical protein
MKQERKPEEKTSQKDPKNLKEKVRKHISDKNDVITEEDMKNITVGEDKTNENTGQAEDLAKTLEQKKITSPWSILSEEDK